MFESSGLSIKEPVVTLILDLIRQDVSPEAIVSMLREVGREKMLPKSRKYSGIDLTVD